MKDNEECKGERKKLTIAIIGMIVVFLSFCGWLINISVERALYNRFEDRGLPRINIDLNGVSLETIKEGKKETKYKNNNLQVYNDGTIKSYSGVEIKGRGNSTWLQDKKPYRIEFSSNKNLLGLGKAKRWVLLANYFDHSHLRNDIAFTLAEMLDTKYDKRGEFVELYFNGNYEGLYYLMQKIEIAKNSVNLRNEGGVLFELDTLHSYEEECNVSYLKDCLVLKEIVLDDEGNRSMAIANFLDFFNEFEMAVEKKDYETIAKKIDVESFSKYFLISEFTVNPDAYNSSFYLYKDGMDDKIHFGPIWDFDYALGNREWIWRADDTFLSPYRDYANTGVKFKIVKDLVEIIEVNEKVSSIFREKMAGRKEELIMGINREVKEISRSAEKDGLRWRRNDYMDNIRELIEWVEKRYDYFEQKYSNNESQKIQAL